MKEAVKKELKQMIEIDVIEKVDQPTGLTVLCMSRNHQVNYS